MPPAAARAAAALAAVLLTTSACSGDPSRSIVTPSPQPSERAACQQLFENLPGTIAGHTGLANRTALVAYWGEKDPVVLRCGVPKPAALEQTSRCDVVNEIGWFTEQTDDGYRFTTIGRAAFVEVVVPSKYAPEADVLVDLSGAVAKVAEVKPCV
ncbi:DUF3515 domain-containing protein [Aestuariimicrobium ganziense]|uniref:DUF3515 domain-containing protein n=1 Tax=Aestuariimicrobium ganziense TaxID=2773677 RepID=UPI0019448F2F|nr:DUF3515 domain-containing protein [Aestuariimicrobium ganziense]